MTNAKLKTYWNEEGKNQDVVNKVSELMPGMGYTSNDYMNLFIAASHVYYDCYNNGGCNLEDCYSEDIDKYISPFVRFTSKTVRRKVKKEQVERLMDKVTDIIKNKDLSFNIFEFYIDYTNQLISKNNTELPDKATFGSEALFNSEYQNRIKNCGYKEV